MKKIKIMFACLFACAASCTFAQHVPQHAKVLAIDQEVQRVMREGDIPGLSLVVRTADTTYIKTYGFADVETSRLVTAETGFELGSCSKAFTALAMVHLVERFKLNWDDTLTQYLPWLHLTYKDKPVAVRLRDLAHHTSGIPWNTISNIPAGAGNDMLEKTVHALEGQELNHAPGKVYEYATINYDVLALIIQQVSGMPFETYLQRHVLNALGLEQTSIGQSDSLMAQGYKIGFFEPRRYNAPVYQGNNAAGYVISNAKDMQRWLAIQMDKSERLMGHLVTRTQQRDESVALHAMAAYAMGWEVSLDGTGQLSHGGLNPAFTSFMAFREKEKIGVVVLANSNSSMTEALGKNIMKLLVGETPAGSLVPNDNTDKAFSILSIVMCGYITLVLAFLGFVAIRVHQGQRYYEGFSWQKLGKFVQALLLAVPFLFALYLLPAAMVNFTWQSILVWTPVSFEILVKVVLLAMVSSYIAYLVTLIFPEKNKYVRAAPLIVLMSVLSGVSNMIVIILITSSLNSGIALKYLVFYYTLTFLVYILGRRFVQISLIRFTRGLIYETRIKLFEKIFATSYQNFEKIDRGRVYTALNEDVGTIGESTNMFVMLITSLFTATTAFLYMATIAFWATVLTIVLISSISLIYFFVSRSTNVFFEQARDTRNVFMKLTHGMIDGFKEISLHRRKKLQYKDDVAASAREYRDKISTAHIRFVNAFMVGESLLIVLLGIVSFAVPRLFPGIELQVIMSFVIVLLYIIGPLNGILSSVPAIMQLKIAWHRIQQFLKEIPAGLELKDLPQKASMQISSFRAIGVKFQYGDKDDTESFAVGPIDLEVNRGEILFIIGGNGSGKTTFAKLMTGLYAPDEGAFMIDRKVVPSSVLGEYFSPIFSPPYLFPKVYEVDMEGKDKQVSKYLRLLNLQDKVKLQGNEYNTIDLSGGQRKRLALFQCYLEEAPIYLFDEWAADQDPGYRHFFYRTLLPEMKKLGKIVIAITHDDHYFDVADKVLVMKQGKLEAFTHGDTVTGADRAVEVLEY